MKKSRLLETIAALLAALLVLGLAFYLDRWLGIARQFNAENFNNNFGFAWISGIYILFAISLIALHWFVNTKNQPNRLVSWALLIFGLMLTFSLVLRSFGVLERLIYFFYPLFSTRMSQTANPFIAVIGAFGLFRKQPQIGVSLPPVNQIIDPIQQIPSENSRLN